MYNKITLVGRLTKDPELRFTGNGNAVCSYSLAVNRNYKNSQGAYEVDFFDIVSWKKLAEISARYLKKGKMILLEGEMQSRKYTTQDGIARTVWEVQARDMKMLSPKEDGTDGNNGKTGHSQPAGVTSIKGNTSGKEPYRDSETGDEAECVDSAALDFEDAPF